MKVNKVHPSSCRENSSLLFVIMEMLFLTVSDPLRPLFSFVSHVLHRGPIGRVRRAPLYLLALFLGLDRAGALGR